MADRTYRDEFPDFAAADMPPIPAHWQDHSWHNDACPSFYAGDRVVIFVDFLDPDWSDFAEERKSGQFHRFNASRLVVDNGEVTDMGEEVCSTDDWDELLAAVANIEKEVADAQG
jgi:hypothetical protein